MNLYAGGGKFFRLETPQDLLDKLRRDYGRILQEPANSDCAFDFFNTANCMVDWVWPSDRIAQRKAREADPVLRVCAHLADGAKHFLLTTPHRGVSAIEHVPAAFAKDAFAPGAFASQAFQCKDELIVTLDADESAALGGARLSVPTLGKIVLNYWEKRIGGPLT